MKRLKTVRSVIRLPALALLIAATLLCLCTLSSETKSRFDYPPILAGNYTDTMVRQFDTVNLSASAHDSNPDGSIICYMFDRNSDGQWDDSCVSATILRIANPSGGPLKVIWGARDNEDVLTCDTFIINFNRVPVGLAMIYPRDSATWASYDPNSGKGSVSLSFSATDADNDPLYYTLLLGKDSSNFVQVYQGSATSYAALSLDTVSSYYWRLNAADPLGQTVTAGGRFRTGRISPIPLNGLVAWYPFNGDAKDESGNGNSGTVYGATLTINRFGRINEAYGFNGTTNYINNGNNSAIKIQNSITISLWANLNAKPPINSSYSLISKNENGGYGLFASNDSGKNVMKTFFWINGKYQDSKISLTMINVNVWYHIVAAFDGNVNKMYLNGIKMDSLSANGLISNVEYPLLIGANPGPSGQSNYMNGKLDDIRIYNRALSEQEIQALYHEGGYVPPLVKPTLSACGVDSTSIRVQWSKIFGATCSVLESAAAKTGPFSQRYSGADTTFAHTGLTKDQQVWYRVKATNAMQQSEWSDTVGAAANDKKEYWMQAQVSTSNTIEYHGNNPNGNGTASGGDATNKPSWCPYNVWSVWAGGNPVHYSVSLPSDIKLPVFLIVHATGTANESNWQNETYLYLKINSKIIYDGTAHWFDYNFTDNKPFFTALINEQGTGLGNALVGNNVDIYIGASTGGTTRICIHGIEVRSSVAEYHF
jgi:hypothetical protein